MIDENGYRYNVAIALVNKENKFFWARRYNKRSWQFPQGGIDEGETPIQAMYRELYEEVGLRPNDVQVLASIDKWIKYNIPDNLIRKNNVHKCIGQQQKWFLLRLVGPDTKINLSATNHPEFDRFRWVSYWYPVDRVIGFKRDAYIRALRIFRIVIKKPNQSQS